MEFESCGGGFVFSLGKVDSCYVMRGAQNASVAAIFLSISILIHLVGVLAERWLFFAEARHAVMSYYD